jgi:hypothetical protein
VRCAGRDDLRLPLAELAAPIGFEFTDDEKKNADLKVEPFLFKIYEEVL